MKEIFSGISEAAFAHAEAIVHRLGKAARGRARDYTYGFNLARDLVQVGGSSAVLWLMYKHKRAAIPVSVATSAVVAGLSGVSAAFDPAPLAAAEDDRPGSIECEEALERRDRIVNALIDALPNVVGSLLLLFNPEATDYLSKPMDLTPRDPSAPFTLPEQARNLASLYMSYTLVGHWLEMAFCQLIKHGIVGGDYDRTNTMLWDWWLHPFPAEGIAGIMIALGLNPLRKKLLDVFGGRVAPALVLSFLATQVVCTSIDYLTGITANRNYELWDYRDMPFNFQGQVCLQNSLVYSAAATLVTWTFYPARSEWLKRMPPDVANLGFTAFSAAYAMLSLIYFV